MRFSKAALESEGWRSRAPDPEPEKPVAAPEPTTAEQLAPMLAEIASALRVRPQPAVVVQESKAKPAKGWRVTVNRNPKSDLIESFDLTRLE